jgi:hypothetical protein
MGGLRARTTLTQVPPTQPHVQGQVQVQVQKRNGSIDARSEGGKFTVEAAGVVGGTERRGMWWSGLESVLGWGVDRVTNGLERLIGEEDAGRQRGEEFPILA